MALRTIAAVRNAAVDAAVDLVDIGVGDGKLQFYTGTPPAAVGDVPAGTLLVEITFAAIAFGAASNGSVAAAGVPLNSTGLADGTIGWARVLDGGGAALWDENDVGTSGNAITVNTTTVSTGVAFAVNSYTFTAS